VNFTIHRLDLREVVQPLLDDLAGDTAGRIARIRCHQPKELAATVGRPGADFLFLAYPKT